MLKIKEIESKSIWENELKNWSEANFLQSYNWGQFHESLGKDVYYLHIFNSEQVIGAAVVIVEKAKRGNYLTIAGGPLFSWDEKDINQNFLFLLNYLKKIAHSKKAKFIRLRLQEKSNDKLKKIMKEAGLIVSPMHLTADLTLQLDLTKDDQTLLKEMRKNTRHEIKKANKLGIKIVVSKDSKEIKNFYKLQLKVAERQHFIPFSYEFLQNQFDIFVKDNQAVLIHSYYDNKLLSSAFIIFYGNEAVYHYGVSTKDNFKLPGSYACQWAAIEEAKKRGMKRYNFWGVNPGDEKDHRFAGVGLFKRGFGGQEIEYLRAYDYPFSFSYYTVYLFEFLRKKFRGL